MGCPPVRKIIHSLKLVDYLHIQADNPWYNYYLANSGDPNTVLQHVALLSGASLFAKVQF